MKATRLISFDNNHSNNGSNMYHLSISNHEVVQYCWLTMVYNSHKKTNIPHIVTNKAMNAYKAKV